MLRRIPVLIASAAVVGLGLCSIPALASSGHVAPKPNTSHSAHGTHNFSMPSIKGHYNDVQGWGSYNKENAAKTLVWACVKQTGSAYAVGAEAVAYNSRGGSKNIAGIIIQGHKGQVSCGHLTFLFYGSHLKVFTFVGNGGHIVAKSKVKTIY
jgi:hypothetical protein